MKNKVLVLGELLIRHTPVGNNLWGNGAETQIFYGGTEANIAVTLSTLGIASKIFSALPENDMGMELYNYFQMHNVDMKNIVWKGERIGQYYATRGIGIRGAEVVYDRKYSSFTTLEINDVNLEEIFAGITHFHVSGVTLALGENIQIITLAMLEFAKTHDITVSIDLNYRSKLWDFQTAKEVMAKFLPYADICFGIEPVALTKNEKTVFPHEQASIEEIKTRMELLKTCFGIKHVFHTKRVVDSSNNNYFQSFMLSKDGFFESKTFSTFIIERVGSGDAFVSGALYGLINNFENTDIVNFGAYLATLKCTEYGDHLKTNAKIIEHFLNDDFQGIKR